MPNPVTVLGESSAPHHFFALSSNQFRISTLHFIWNGRKSAHRHAQKPKTAICNLMLRRFPLASPKSQSMTHKILAESLALAMNAFVQIDQQSCEWWNDATYMAWQLCVVGDFYCNYSTSLLSISHGITVRHSLTPHSRCYFAGHSTLHTCPITTDGKHKTKQKNDELRMSLLQHAACLNITIWQAR